MEVVPYFERPQKDTTVLGLLQEGEVIDASRMNVKKLRAFYDEKAAENKKTLLELSLEAEQPGGAAASDTTASTAGARPAAAAAASHSAGVSTATEPGQLDVGEALYPLNTFCTRVPHGHSRMPW